MTYSNLPDWLLIQKANELDPSKGKQANLKPIIVGLIDQELEARYQTVKEDLERQEEFNSQ